MSTGLRTLPYAGMNERIVSWSAGSGSGSSSPRAAHASASHAPAPPDAVSTATRRPAGRRPTLK